MNSFSKKFFYKIQKSRTTPRIFGISFILGQLYLRFNLHQFSITMVLNGNDHHNCTPHSYFILSLYDTSHTCVLLLHF